MAGVSILETLEVAPNPAVRTHLVTLPNSTDVSDTVALTLSDYGISATGLLTMEGFRHTTDGSVIVTETLGLTVSSGVATVTFQEGSNDFRVLRFSGKSDVGDFS